MAKHLTTSYKEIIKFSVRKISDNYQTINSGGCGLFAKALGNLLEVKGFNVNYIILCKTNYGARRVNEMVADGDYVELLDSPHLWSHVITTVNGKIVDTSGVFNNMGEYARRNVYYERLNLRPSRPIGKRFLKDFVNSTDGWNNTFDRSLIKKIERSLEKNLVY